jgi:hypothetical protein
MVAPRRKGSSRLDGPAYAVALLPGMVDIAAVEDALAAVP